MRTIPFLVIWLLTAFVSVHTVAAQETAQETASADTPAISAKQLVVMIDGRFPTTGQLTSGAGIIVGRKGGLVYIATAGHVVKGLMEDASDIKIQFQDRPGEEVDATLWPSNFDKGTDLAILVVPDAGAPETVTSITSFPAARIAQDVRLGEGAFLFGQPQGRVWSGNKAPEQVISATTTSIEIKSDSVVPGMSGGATFDEGLRLIGLIVETENGVARAIPLKFLKEIIEKGGYPFDLIDISVDLSIQADGNSRKELARQKILTGGFTLDRNGLRDSLYSGTSLIEEYSDIGVSYERDHFLEDVRQAPDEKSLTHYMTMLTSYTSEGIRSAKTVAMSQSEKLHDAFLSAETLAMLCQSKPEPDVPQTLCKAPPGYSFARKLTDFINLLYAFADSEIRLDWKKDLPGGFAALLHENASIVTVDDIVNDLAVLNPENQEKTFVSDIRFWINLGVSPIESGKTSPYAKAVSYDDRLSYDLYQNYCLHVALVEKHWNRRFCEMTAAVYIHDNKLHVVDQLITDEDFIQLNAAHWDEVYLTESSRAMATAESIDQRLQFWVVCDRGNRNPYVILKSARTGSDIRFPEIMGSSETDVSFAFNDGQKISRTFTQTNLSYVYTSQLDERLYNLLSGKATSVNAVIRNTGFDIKLHGSTKAINDTLSRHNCMVR